MKKSSRSKVSFNKGAFRFQRVYFLEFDLNNVAGHVNYDYAFMLDRIEQIILDKNKDEDEETKDDKFETPVTRFISTKTSW